DLRAGLALDELEVFLRRLGQLVVVGDALGGGVPALEFGVDRLDGLKATDVGRDDVGLLAVDLIAGADGDVGALVEYIHLGDDEPFGTVDHVGVAQQWQIEPAATARATGDGAVLLAAGADEGGGFVVDLGGKRAFADAGDVGLGDADYGADGGGTDAGADRRSTGGGRGTGDEGVGAVVDIEQRALGALEHHLVAGLDGVIQQHGGIGDEGRDLFRGAGVFVVDGLGIERFGAEERLRDGVLLIAGVVDVRAQQCGVEQVNDAEPAAVHLVLVGGADAAAGGADLRAAGGVLGGELDHAVVGQDDLRAIGDEELAVDGKAGVAKLLDLAEEGH